MGSHSVTCHPAEVTFPPLPQPKLVLDLATPEGCKAELTIDQYINKYDTQWQTNNETRLSKVIVLQTDGHKYTHASKIIYHSVSRMASNINVGFGRGAVTGSRWDGNPGTVLNYETLLYPMSTHIHHWSVSRSSRCRCYSSTAYELRCYRSKKPRIYYLTTEERTTNLAPIAQDSLTLKREHKCSHNQFLANVNSRYVCLSVICRLSVTFVHPTQAIEISAMFLRYRVPWPSIDIQVKFYGDRTRGTPPSGPIERYISETVQDGS